jgi:hypothetical protein
VVLVINRCSCGSEQADEREADGASAGDDGTTPPGGGCADARAVIAVLKSARKDPWSRVPDSSTWNVKTWGPNVG